MSATTYIAYWQRSMILKVGFTMAKRWRAFELRGARILALASFDDGVTALELEIAMQGLLGIRHPAAFLDSDSARPFLGGSGAGYTECYAQVSAETAVSVAQTMQSIAREHARCICMNLPSMAVLASNATYERTYGTYGRIGHLESLPSTWQTRADAYGPDFASWLVEEVERVLEARQ